MFPNKMKLEKVKKRIMYFQLVSVNLKCKVFASETKKINIQMII